MSNVMPDKKFEFKRDKILFVFFSNNFMYENKADFLSQIKKLKYLRILKRLFYPCLMMYP